MINLLLDEIKGLIKPKVVFFANDRRFEGIILAIDDVFIKFHDPKRCYTRFIKLETISDLEVKE